MKKNAKQRVSVPSDPLLAAAVFHSDMAEKWRRTELLDRPGDSPRFKDNCRKWYALHRMWQKAIEKAAAKLNTPKETWGRPL